MTLRRHSRYLLVIVALLTMHSAVVADTSLRAIDKAVAVSEYEHALDLIDAQLVVNPEDVALRLRRAQVLGYNGDNDAAMEALSELHRQYPQDVDYLFARAQLLARQERDREALDDLRQAVALAPDYEDVWKLRHKVLSRQYDEVAQFELQALLRDVAVHFPRADWWRTTESDAVARWTVLIGAGHENLSNGAPSWKQQFVEVSREQDSEGNYRLGLARDERFDDSDLTIRVAGEYSFASDWLAGFDLNTASDPTFQPGLGYGGFVSRSMLSGYVVSLRYGRREYETVTVGSTTAGLERYIGDFRFAYALGLSHLHGASNSMNHNATVNWYYNERASVGVSLNSGEEAEAIGPGQVLQTDVRGISVNGRHQLTDRFGLQWWLGLHDQGDFYRRQYVGMAVSIRL